VRLLLDTHIVLWAVLDDPGLSPTQRNALTAEDREVYVSAASLWEIAIKHALGKLAVPERLAETLLQAGCRPLPITWRHAQAADQLPRHHADPFDRMLVAQARCEDLMLMTRDAKLRRYEVELFPF
jgi:PIN domain nuclease of toxin-antitoxin system